MNRRHMYLSGLAVSFLLACSASPPPVVLHDVTVIDGTGTVGRPYQVIVLQGDRISQLGPVDDVEIPDGARVMDFSGKFVVPGFVDLHVHFPEDAVVQEAMLARLLEFGITTILNPGARPGAGVSLRQRIESGDVLGPRLFTAGRIIDHDPVDDGLKSWAARVTSRGGLPGRGIDAFVGESRSRSVTGWQGSTPGLALATRCWAGSRLPPGLREGSWPPLRRPR